MRPIVLALATKCIEVPIIRVPKGRPRKERHRRDARGQRAPPKNRIEGPVNQQQRCSTCQGIGHNARTCRNPYM